MTGRDRSDDPIEFEDYLPGFSTGAQVFFGGVLLFLLVMFAVAVVGAPDGAAPAPSRVAAPAHVAAAPCRP